MRFSWRNITRGLLSYSRSDRNAILIIGASILLVVIANAIVKNLEPQPTSDFSEIKLMLEEWENAEAEKQINQKLIFFHFDPNTIPEKSLDSLSIPIFVKKNMLSYRKAGGVYKTSADFRKIYGMNDSIFALLEEYITIKEKKEVQLQPSNKPKIIPTGFFDPNTASIAELKQFGFSHYQSNNLVNYRNNGGVFRSSTDLLKIYGIDSVFYYSIYQYIKMTEAERKVDNEPKEIIVIELNEADSADLVKLVGVGPIYANRIIKYRNLLGGFYSKEQLKEIYSFPEETFMQIKDNVRADTLSIKRLRINFSEFDELLRHPYFNKKQVQALLYRRERLGSFKDVSDLSFIEEFDPETIRKVRPYVTCR